MEAIQLTEEAPTAGRMAGAAVGRQRARHAIEGAVALALLILALPLLLVIALAIRLDSAGPAIYRQRRLGRDMQPFTLHKFRSMRVNAAPDRHRAYVSALIQEGNADPEHGQRRSLYKLVVDDRVTGIGRFLRRYSLDELPQLWNVVRGEMSLVGPRPVIPYEAEQYPAEWRERFAVKPGLTGLWQVSGRNERTYEEMVRYDIEYARARGVRLDLSILARTAWVVVRGKGAV